MSYRKQWTKFTSLALVMVMVIAMSAALFGGAGSARAEGSTFKSPDVVVKAIMKATQTTTSISQDDILKELRMGHILADVITNHNGDVAAIKAAATTDITDQTNAAVTAATLTQAQADTFLGRLSDMIDMILYIPLPDRTQSVQLVIGWALINAVENATKLTTVQLLKEIVAGNTLAQIITTHGSSVASVKAAAKTDITDQANQAVADKTVTQADATKFVTALDGVLDKIINNNFGDGKGGALSQEMQLMRTAALSLLVKQTAVQSNISQRDLLKEIHSGKSLAQIATEHSADPAKIIEMAVQQATTRINTLVKNNQLDQTHAAAFFSGLRDDVTSMMNDTNPFHTAPASQ